MAVAKIDRGVEIDFVSPADMRRILREEMSGYNRPPQTIWPFESVQLNASGNSFQGYQPVGQNEPAAMVTLYNPEVGYEFSFHRCAISVSSSTTTYTFGSPYTSGTGYIEFRRAESRLGDGIPLTAPGIPRVWTAGGSDGIRTVNGAPISVIVVGGPANATLQFDMQGFLNPIYSMENQKQKQVGQLEV